MKIYGVNSNADTGSCREGYFGNADQAWATLEEAQEAAYHAWAEQAVFGSYGDKTLKELGHSPIFIECYEYDVRLGDAGEYGGEDGDMCIEYVDADGDVVEVEWVDDYELSVDSARRCNKGYLDGAPDCVIDAFEEAAKDLLARKRHEDKECVFGFCGHCK